jgi:hypothetical protein
MREASARAHVTRLIHESNFVGAYLYLKDAELEKEEHDELVGMLASSVAEEISSTRRDDKERIYFLRSILAWILRDVPGLSGLYREQLREQQGGNDLLSFFARGARNIGDVATGRKRVSDGIQDAADEAKRNLEDAAESIRSGETRDRLNQFFSSAQDGLRSGLDQLGAFFKELNEEASDDDTTTSESPEESDAASAARADTDRDVEDVEFTPDDDGPKSDRDSKPKS